MLLQKKGSAIILLFNLIVFASLFSFFIYAHGTEDNSSGPFKDLNLVLKDKGLTYIFIGTAAIILLVAIAMRMKNQAKATKLFFFVSIAAITTFITVYLAASTIFLNVTSQTKGPVHWHSDFEIYDCGQKVDLEDPRGLSNRIGTPVFHEHNDDRVHVEGVVMEGKDVDMHTFFRVVGGELSHEHLKIPTGGGMIEIRNGELCGGQPAKLQGFLYRVKNPDDVKQWKFEQEKLDDFENYIMAPYTNIPPGDCIVIEFGPEKEKTEHLCSSYRVSMEKGELSGG